jgi:hypothetical protein
MHTINRKDFLWQRLVESVNLAAFYTLMNSFDKNKEEPPAVNQFNIRNILIACHTNKCYVIHLESNYGCRNN